MVYFKGKPVSVCCFAFSQASSDNIHAFVLVRNMVKMNRRDKTYGYILVKMLRCLLHVVNAFQHSVQAVQVSCCWSILLCKCSHLESSKTLYLENKQECHWYSTLNLWNFSGFPAMHTISMIIYNGLWQMLLSKEVCGYIQIRCHYLGSNKNFTDTRLKTLRKWMWSFRRKGLKKGGELSRESPKVVFLLTNNWLCCQTWLYCFTRFS